MAPDEGPLKKHMPIVEGWCGSLRYYF